MTEHDTPSGSGKKHAILRFSYGVEKANSYIIEDSGHAVIIDACSDKVVRELQRSMILPDYLILTHEHCDHLWGVNAIRAAFPNVRVVAQNRCSEAIADPIRNKAREYHIYAAIRFGTGYRNEEGLNRNYFCAPADLAFEEQTELIWQGLEFEISHAPGHSPGSVLISLKGTGVFSGDSILREKTCLKFDGGDEDAFNSVTLPQILNIPEDTLIFPGHGDIFRMNEWKTDKTVNKDWLKDCYG